MKKLFVLGLTLLLVVSTLSISSFAEDNTVIEPRANASDTIVDALGSRYVISGTAVKYSNGGSFTTSFSTSYVNDGEMSSTENYYKYLTVTGTIALSGGGYYPQESGEVAGFKKTGYFWSSSGSKTTSKTGLEYTATSVTGAHTANTTVDSTSLYSYQY